MYKKLLSILIIAAMCLGVAACAQNGKPSVSAMPQQYDELLGRIRSGEEMFSDDGMGYTYDEAENPGYALYDMDKDGTDELFLTADIERQDHTYSVYFLKEGAAVRAGAINGYIPGKDLWTYYFDYFVEGYTFDSKEGFERQWELDYPWVDGIEVNTIIYEGQEPAEISDEELDALMESAVTEPEDVVWIDL